jgi:apolipoprotein N-acyltransferase
MAKSSILRWIPAILSVSGGLLLWAAWPTSPLTFLIFIAFIPLLRLTDVVESRKKYYGSIYLLLFIWNVATTWWVGNTTVPISGLAANLINTTVMSVPLMGYHSARRRMGSTAAYFALIVYWLTFEYVHMNWEFSWPWLSLGNAFAMRPSWIQWYEYTGATGGTVWVLLANISIYQTWLKRKHYWKPVAVIVVPLLISVLVQYQFKAPEGPAAEVVVVQPNIDPYDKFADSNSAQQLDKLLKLSGEKADSQTTYIIWPETALFTRGGWENKLTDETETEAIRQFLKKYPQATVVSGATTLKQYNNKLDDIPYTARPIDETASFDAFNSAIQIDTSATVQVYHKYKMVPGVEMVPYARYMWFMKYVALDMGGITGSYGRTPDEEVLSNPAKNIKVSAAICYESVYGDYVADHVRKGANLLFIITNDGWWGNSEGHRQHVQYARLRAIETRRWVARSANTGISCIIDPVGNIQQPLPYWKEGVIKGNVTPGHILTFYVKYGDLISQAAIAFCILLLVYSYYLRFRQKKVLYARQNSK